MHKRSFLLAATSSTALVFMGCSQDDGSAPSPGFLDDEADTIPSVFDSETSAPPTQELSSLAPVVRERPYGDGVASTHTGRRFKLSVGERPLVELDEEEQPMLEIAKFVPAQRI
jgi:hypothetical protein